MAFGIARPVLPLAVEMVGRRLDNFGSGRPRLFAMGVQPSFSLI